MEIATFGAGCFWGVEANFSKINGVELTVVGYMGGKTKDPSYEEVCTNKTGHAEVVQLTYDPKKISYEKLLDIFWNIHDPTTKNKQGLDIGSQYRSIIFYHNIKQKKLALNYKKELDKSGRYSSNIVTEIRSASKFYKAEEYHQKYFKKNKKIS